MADNLPTTDELYKSANLPSTDDLYQQAQARQTPFNPFDINNVGNQSGPIADIRYGIGHLNDILSAGGQAAANEWGAIKDPTAQQMYESMDPEDAKADKEHVKGANESWIRPLAAKILASEATHALVGLNYLYRPIAAGMTFVGGATQALGEKLPRAIGEPLEEAAAAAPTLHLPEGGIPEEQPATVDLRPWMNTPQRLQTARAKGLIGPDGERGFFGLTEITPKEVQSRLEAATKSGSEAAIEQREPPTLDDLAQQINPEAFVQREDLQGQLDLARQSLQVLREEKENLPELASLKAQEKEIVDRVNGNEEELSEVNADRLSEIRSGIFDLQERRSPEEADLESSITGILSKLNDIQPYIQEAYQHATRLYQKSPDESIAESGEEPIGVEGPTPQKEQPQGAPQKAQEAGKTATPIGGTKNAGRGPGGPAKGFKSLSGAATPEDLKAQISKELEDADELIGVPPLAKKDQIKAATNLVTDHPDEALQFINGEIEIPGVHPQMALRALRAKAAAEGDVELGRAIVKSKANKEASAAGQTLGMRSGIYSDLDPSSIIADIELNRQGGLRQQVKARAQIKAVADVIKRNVEESVNKYKEDWETFLTKIACDE